jgi:hypothetical protein
VANRTAFATEWFVPLKFEGDGPIGTKFKESVDMDRKGCASTPPLSLALYFKGNESSILPDGVTDLFGRFRLSSKDKLYDDNRDENLEDFR